STTDDPAKEASQLRVMRAQRVAGVIFIPGGRTQDTATLGPLLRVPTVLLDRTLTGLDLDSVVLDNVMAGRLATDHLLDQGHRRIAVVAGNSDLALSRERVAGYRDAMLARGVPFDEALVADGGFQSEPSYRATLELLCRRPRPSAFVAANNHGTVGVMMALRDRGLDCPRDVSVVGIDDFTWAEAFSPRLTAVAQPIVAMGREAARLLLARCASPDPDGKIAVVLQPRLIVRDSTRRLAVPRRKPLLTRPYRDGSRSSSIP
ncbi:MAG TPA: substrate-binding domain-containing protein, partial [Lichenihabitans sp.]|nr:substrate-binding domain-containing protein [Lichenihabitans sp.]